YGEEADDQAQAGPRVHPPVEQPQLGRAGLELQDARRGAQTSSARGSSGFTSGHASWPQVVDVMERIKSRTRIQGGGTERGPLLDDLIRPRQQRRRDREAKGLGGLEVDDQHELCGLLDCPPRVCALQDLVDETCRASPEVYDVCAI